jgi:23S rRNA (guanine745-N1)-methyltransferase
MCPKKHSFDIGKEKYVNLLLNSSQSTGDDKHMILARNAFLEKGYYIDIANKLFEIIKSSLPSNAHINIIDAGCGEGYYLNYLYESLQDNIISYYGFDISKKAVQIAAKRNQNINWFVGNAFNIPLLNHSIDFFISMFAFYSVNEVERILNNNGIAIIFRAGKNHLIELKSILYNELSLKDSNHEFDNARYIIDKQNLHCKIEVKSNEDIENLLLMTPHYWKTKLENKELLKYYNSLICTLDVDIYLVSKHKNTLNIL